MVGEQGRNLVGLPSRTLRLRARIPSACRHHSVGPAQSKPNRYGVAAAITRSLRLRLAPGNLYLPQGTGGLNHDSVVNVSQLVTLDRRRLHNLIGRIPPAKLSELDDGPRLVLAL